MKVIARFPIHPRRITLQNGEYTLYLSIPLCQLNNSDINKYIRKKKHLQAKFIIQTS